MAKSIIPKSATESEKSELSKRVAEFEVRLVKNMISAPLHQLERSRLC